MSTTASSHPGATLAALRAEAGLSQRQLARTIGVSFSHLSRVEAGERSPSADLYRRAANAIAEHLHQQHGGAA